VILVKSFRNVFYVSELRKKILFTLGCLAIFRLGAIIPIPGINISILADYLKQAANLGLVFNYLGSFAGARLEACTLFALGIGPYITASIVIQLFGLTLPHFEELMKEGEYGRQTLNQYTRYLALGLSVFYSFGYAMLLHKTGAVVNPGLGFTIVFVSAMTAGTMFVMWLGDQISLFGLGNGSSMIIFAGIVTRLPNQFVLIKTYLENGSMSPLIVAISLVLFVLFVVGIVFLEKGDRKIPIQYARRVVGNRVYGGQSTYIPFKVNPVGVMPVIFAAAALQLPMMVTNFIIQYAPSWTIVKNLISPGSSFFISMEFLLIIFFTFVWTALQYNPDELAENLKKNGGFIPGVRPGTQTSKYIDYILNRIGLVGALYLGVLAVGPAILSKLFDIQMFVQGTSLLIMVGVALEFASQAESYLIDHRYEGFLTSGRVKTRM
jgi:preprotein translocase subunit SecY